MIGKLDTRLRAGEISYLMNKKAGSFSMVRESNE